ncbi:MAG TPA: permease prefix domain 1-containing protein [Candidatus Limnocylindrales bacterium]|nr:permease prefix domain 1-containing protein [Candidatus Limnocylindrales bacterium]
MARHHLSAQPDQAQVDAYLSALAGWLHGPRRRRARILAELKDGLTHAIDGHVSHGRSQPEATSAAIAEFGAPQVVAQAFAGELTAAHARKTIAAYVATGPLVGIWWLLLLRPYPWHGGLIALLAAIPVIPMIAIIMAMAVGTLATTGSLMRWLPETHPRRALTLTMTIAALALAADVTVVALYIRSDIPMQTLAAVACTASLIRIVGGALTLRRTTTMRRWLDQTTSSSPREDRDARR